MKSILVTGDLIVDHDLAQLPGAPSAYFEPLPHTVLGLYAGGAWYLEDVVRITCREASFHVIGPERGDERSLRSHPNLAHAHSLWAPHPQVRGKGSSEQVWRIREFLGCQAAAEPEPGRHAPLASDPDVLLIDDLNLGFSNNRALWPEALERVLERGPAGGTQVVFKTTPPLAEDLLWKELISRCASRLTVVLSVTALRNRHAGISRALSWDLAVEDLQREFTTGISSRDLARAARVVVHLDSGAMGVFRGGPDACCMERFVFRPAELEGTWSAQRPGDTFGATSLVTAAMARHVADPRSYPLFIAAGRALSAIAAVHDLGKGRLTGDPDDRPRNDAALDTLRRTFHPDPGAPAPEAGCRAGFGPEARAFFAEAPLRADRADLLQDFTGYGTEYIAAKALQVVIRGTEKVLDSAPRAQYGAYFTVDREEIERINEIRRLILGYQAAAADRRPLSIAVFGPAGSGKSFAIKQLAKQLFPDNRAELEFNLSQFQDVADLHRAFHQVRDATVRGEIPFVFWDEFDSGDLGWLKEFLAPMQDAVFREGSIAHPFGKAIFVFAGGTSFDFQSFDRSEPEHKESEYFRVRKGPDFVSRLRGYVNIKGPNPAGKDDLPYLIRRAILLRSVLQRSYPGLIHPVTGEASISAGVIRAFLRVVRYRHGARSLEAVVNMSSLPGARHFGVDALPSPDLLALHVTADFLEHVREGQLEQPMPRILDLLARAGHHGWAEQKRAQGYVAGRPRRDTPPLTHPDLVEWDELPEPRKALNRDPAARRLIALYQLGYRVESAAGGADGSGLSSEDLERLVRSEHEIWLRDRLIHGWERASEVDEACRLHTDICAFEGLAPAHRELNRAIVSAIPPTLAAAGYVLRKKVEPVPGGEEERTRG